MPNGWKWGKGGIPLGSQTIRMLKNHLFVRHRALIGNMAEFLAASAPAIKQAYTAETGFTLEVQVDWRAVSALVDSVTRNRIFLSRAPYRHKRNFTRNGPPLDNLMSLTERFALCENSLCAYDVHLQVFCRWEVLCFAHLSNYYVRFPLGRLYVLGAYCGGYRFRLSYDLCRSCRQH